jgi:hypothetical protein
VLFGFLISQEETKNGRVGMKSVFPRLNTKDVMLGRVVIRRSFEVTLEKTEEGKMLIRIIALNEIAFTEMILSIGVSSSNSFWNLQELQDKRI